MNRRKFVGSLLATAATGATSTRAQAAQTAPAAFPRPVDSGPDDRPNILWICTDQQRWDTVETLGNPDIRTPHLNRLAREGVAFTHAYCQNPICTPSRASFLTGRYPRSIDACTNGNERWKNEAPLVTKLLADSGYYGGLAGKFHLSAAHNRIEPRVDDGYRVFHWSHHPHDSWPNGHDYNDWLLAQGINHDETKARLGYIPTEYHQTKWCADRAIDFMTEPRQGPWFFSYNCFDPHPPLDPPQDYLDRIDQSRLTLPAFDEADLAEEQNLADVHFQQPAQRLSEATLRLNLAKYYAMIELIDDQVGRMLDALELTGQRENTIVIFTSDHGHMIGDHGLYNKGCRFYEGLVRVPLIWSWPGQFQANVVSDEFVELVDIAPTLLAVAGVEGAADMHGRSLEALLRGEGAGENHREYARSTYSNTLEGVASFGTMIRDRRYKLCTYHGTGKGQLFDMKTDPNEHQNHWNSPEFQETKLRLLQASFDIEAMTTDIGSGRIGRY